MDPSTCEDCTREANLFNPVCVNCGARMIRAIQALRIPPENKAARCRAVLKDWMAFGHDEAELRRLAKGSASEHQANLAAHAARRRPLVNR